MIEGQAGGHTGDPRTEGAGKAHVGEDLHRGAGEGQERGRGGPGSWDQDFAASENGPEAPAGG